MKHFRSHLLLFDQTTSLMSEFDLVTYRTSAMTHPDVAFNVKSRRSSEPERFHVSEYLGLEHLAFAPRSSESADQLVVDGAPVNKRQSDRQVRGQKRIVCHFSETIARLQPS